MSEKILSKKKQISIKQVATKKPRTAHSGLEAPKRAIKSAKVAPAESASPKRLPAIPPVIGRIISTAKKAQEISTVARKSVPIVSKIKPVQKRKPVVSKSKFLTYSVPKKVFQRLCRDIAFNYIPDCRFTLEALTALHTAMEDFMVGFFEDAAMCMRHANRKTLFVKDMDLVSKLRRFDFEPL